MQIQWNPGYFIGVIRKIDTQIKEWKKLQGRAEILVDRVGYWICGILILVIITILFLKG